MLAASYLLNCIRPHCTQYSAAAATRANGTSAPRCSYCCLAFHMCPFLHAFHPLAPSTPYPSTPCSLPPAGRGGNVWTSPAGCLMFTSLRHLQVQGTQAAFINYVVCLAVVQGIKQATQQLLPVGAAVKALGCLAEDAPAHLDAAAATAAAAFFRPVTQYGVTWPPDRRLLLLLLRPAWLEGSQHLDL